MEQLQDVLNSPEYKPTLDLFRSGDLVSGRFRVGSGSMVSMRLDRLHSPAALSEQVKSLAKPHQLSYVAADRNLTLSHFYLCYNDRILIGPKGQGKTDACMQHSMNTGAMILPFRPEEEALRKQFPDGSASYGSESFHMAMTETLKNKTSFRPIGGDPKQIQHNRDASEHMAYTVVGSHLFVFNAFLDCRPEHISLEDWLREWPAIQTASSLLPFDPDHIGPTKDIFVRCTEVLRTAPTLALVRLIQGLSDQIKLKAPMLREKLSLVVTNASYGLNHFNTDHFRLRDRPDEPCSVLPEFLHACLALNGVFTSTVFSTQSGVSAGTMKRALESTAASFDFETVEVPITGGFWNTKDLRKFLEDKLKCWAKEHGISRKCLKRFLNRAVYWLCGPYVSF